MFTFKTEKSTGRYRAFYSDNHAIKLNKIEVGFIDDEFEHMIHLRVLKDDPKTSTNPNCKWKWIKFKQKFKTLQEAKTWLNENFDLICNTFKLYSEET